MAEFFVDACEVRAVVVWDATVEYGAEVPSSCDAVWCPGALY